MIDQSHRVSQRPSHAKAAEIAFTYQNDKLKSRVEKLADAARAEHRPAVSLRCQQSDDEIDAVFAALGKHWDGLDIIVHSVGFAPREQLAGGFVESITREGYAISHDISAYSLAALAKAGLPMMEGRNGAMLALTYNAADARSYPTTTSWAWPKPAWRPVCASWRPIWVPRAFASTRSRQVP